MSGRVVAGPRGSLGSERRFPVVPTRGEIARTYDAIAEEFDAARTRPWPETLTFEVLLPRGSQVLDLACGNGRNLAALRGLGHVVVGLDASSSLLARAAAKVGIGSLVLGDVVSLPFRSFSFDAVHCVAAIHHLPSEGERVECLREAVRVLRPGGLLLVSAWALEQERFHSVIEEHTRKGDAAPVDVTVPWRRSDGRVFSRFYHLFRAVELENLVSRAGLAVERMWREGDNHVVVARR